MRRWREFALPAALWLICAGCLATQLFIPPFIGIANTGDFARVAGHLALDAPDHEASKFVYFQPDYIHSVRSYWDSPYTSSETLLGWVALKLAGADHEGGRFDIRWLGAVHAALFLTALAVLLLALRRMQWWGAAAVAGTAILAFTDVIYAANLNSFYMDVPALCALLVMAAAASWIAVSPEPSRVQIGLFLCAGLLFATSKNQHAPWAFLPAAFLAFSGWRAKRWSTRWLAIAAGVLIFAGSLALSVTADPTNRAQALFNKLFWHVGMAPTGAGDLRGLGVRPEELRYIGTHSFSPGSPVQDQPWAIAFYARTGFGRLLKWYVTHPGRTARMLYRTLTEDAPPMRSHELSNFRQVDGHPPAALTSRFTVWSGFRGALLRRWPFHMVLWYVLFLLGAAAIARAGHSPIERRMAWVAAWIAALGVGEFLLSSLADALDNPRHLLLFHASTDLTICIAIAFAVSRLHRRLSAR